MVWSALCFLLVNTHLPLCSPAFHLQQRQPASDGMDIIDLTSDGETGMPLVNKQQLNSQQKRSCVVTFTLSPHLLLSFVSSPCESVLLAIVIWE
jgi:hypothetical protein